ncbi:MAG: hypothetical protein PHO44_09030, partial [Sphaerochaetaceae bacterium]|nr:hypothetical protein [Sphaerochaetaceae bacterium]
MDDKSRLVTHAQFYLNERTESLLDCMWKAFNRRGLPVRVYTDYPEEKTMTKGIGLCLQAMELPDDCSA